MKMNFSVHFSLHLSLQRFSSPVHSHNITVYFCNMYLLCLYQAFSKDVKCLFFLNLFCFPIKVLGLHNLHDHYVHKGYSPVLCGLYVYLPSRHSAVIFGLWVLLGNIFEYHCCLE